jgi:hypothetical protein
MDTTVGKSDEELLEMQYQLRVREVEALERIADTIIRLSKEGVSISEYSMTDLCGALKR